MDFSSLSSITQSITGVAKSAQSAVASVSRTVDSLVKGGLTPTNALGVAVNPNLSARVQPLKNGKIVSNAIRDQGTTQEKFEHVIYPPDLGDYFLQFHFKKPVSQIETSQENFEITKYTLFPEAAITLPVPGNLIETQGVGYSELQVGNFLRALAANYKDIASAVNGAGEITNLAEQQKLRKQISGIIESNIKSQDWNKLIEQAKFHGFQTIVGAVSSDAGALLGQIHGVIPNYTTAMIFQGVGVKTYAFNYRFVPSSPDESQKIKRIGQLFKLLMLPTRNGLFLTYPYECHMKFGPKEGIPFAFKPCVLESFSIDYAPSGRPTFFTGTNLPVEINMAMAFKETSFWTRDEIEKEIAAERNSTASPEFRQMSDAGDQ